MTSAHYTNERGDREYIIKNIIGYGNVVDRFVVEKKGGRKEIHELSDTGIVSVFTYNSNKLITRLIARPSQVKRYYEFIGEDTPQNILELARKHSMAYGYYNR